MKITDVAVRRYSASTDARRDAPGIQIVDVQTDAGITGTGFVSMASGGSAQGDVVATLIRRALAPAILGADPLLTEDDRRRHKRAWPFGHPAP